MKVSFIFLIFFLAVAAVFGSPPAEEDKPPVHRVVRADKPPYLPRPTPPRPIH